MSHNRFVEPVKAVANAGVAVAKSFTSGLVNHAFTDASLFSLGHPKPNIIASFQGSMARVAVGVVGEFVDAHDRILGRTSSLALSRLHLAAMDANISDVGELHGRVTGKLRAVSASERPGSATFKGSEIVAEARGEAKVVALRSLKDAFASHRADMIRLTDLNKFFRKGATAFALNDEAPQDAFYSLASRCVAVTGLAALATVGFHFDQARAGPMKTIDPPAFSAKLPTPPVIAEREVVPANLIVESISNAKKHHLPINSVDIFGMGMGIGIGIPNNGLVDSHSIHGNGEKIYAPSDKFIHVARAIATVATGNPATADRGMDGLLNQAKTCMRNGFIECSVSFGGVTLDFTREKCVATVNGVVVAQDVKGNYREDSQAVAMIYDRVAMNYLESKHENLDGVLTRGKLDGEERSPEFHQRY